MTARRTAGAVVAAAVLLPGCSGDGEDPADRSPEDVRADAVAAMETVGSVHLELVLGSGEQGFRQDLRVSTDGSCTGTVEQPDGTTEVRRNADGAWYRPSPALVASLFPKRTAQATAFVGDRWVVDLEDAVTGPTCDFSHLVESLGDDLADDAEVTGTEEIDGHEVVRLEYATDEGDGTAFVRAEAPHYIVRMEVEGELPGHLTFSEFDGPVRVEAPAPDEVVDLSEFRRTR